MHPTAFAWPALLIIDMQKGMAAPALVRNNPMAEDNIARLLEAWRGKGAEVVHVRGIGDLAIVGVSTNNSVEASARTAGQLGFAVRVLSDATFAFAGNDYAGTPRSADEVHLMALANLDGEYATVIDTAGLLASLPSCY